jgi:hypothetical protein
MSQWTDRRDAARERGRADPSLIPHGLSSGFDYWGCRCDRCTAAKRVRWAVSKARVNPRRNARLKRVRAQAREGGGQ